MMDEFGGGGGGALVQFGGRFEGAVQFVIGCTESSLSPSERFMLKVLKRAVEREKRELESSESSESSKSSESLMLESASRLITGSRNGGG